MSNIYNNTSVTEDWQLYENGKQYNQRIKPNYYDTVNANIDFFAGNQWRNSENIELEKPVFNMIKRILTFQVAQLMSSNVKANVTPLLFSGEQDNHAEGAEIATAEIENLFEKLKFTNKLRECYFDAGIMGDVAYHTYFDPTKKPYRGDMGLGIKGEIVGEKVLGTNVFFGNANNPDVQTQPYIIVSGRDTVANLKAQAQLYKEQSNDIEADSLYNYEAGDTAQIEVNGDKSGKALYVIKYWKDKKTGTIKANKSVQNTYIFKDIDTGLDRYPIAWLPWEKQQNQYHGRSMVTGVIPNQIFINKMFAMVMYNLMQTAFPKLVYNGDVTGTWNNQIGQAIKVTGLGAEANIHNVAKYLEAGNMSSQITGVIDMAMAYTKETLGISDAALGNINPTNTSAIIAVQKSSAIPLENIRQNGYDFIEDIVLNLMDMMGTYYGERPVIKGKDDEQQEIQTYDFGQLKSLWLSTKIDVGESSYWSEVTATQTLDNLLAQNRIEFLDYLERIPNGAIPNKESLIEKLKEATQMQQQQMMQQAQPQPTVDQQQYEQMAQFFESLPQDQQEQLKQLPPDQFEVAVMELMQQQ